MLSMQTGPGAKVHPDDASEDHSQQHVGFERWCKLRREAGVPDDHLFLGVTEQAVWMFARMIGFPDRFSRKAFFDSQETETKRFDWITSSFGEKLTGYDFVHCIRDWHKHSEQHEYSSAEYLRKEGYEGVGYPVVFLSHVQSEPLEATLRVTKSSLWAEATANHGEPYFWLDYLILRQCTSDFKPEYIVAVIQAISWTTCVEDERESYFDRLFCVFEVSSSTMFAGDGNDNIQLDIVFSEKHAKMEHRLLLRIKSVLLIAMPLLVVGGFLASIMGIRYDDVGMLAFGIATAVFAPTFIGCILVDNYFGNPDKVIERIRSINRVESLGPLRPIFRASRRLSKLNPFNTRSWLDTENSKYRDENAKEQIHAFVKERGGFEMLDTAIALSSRFAASRRRRHRYLSHRGRTLLDLWLPLIQWSSYILFVIAAVAMLALSQLFSPVAAGPVA
eukprot:TRINITY_DN56614_c3_g1_i1.p1 TRINITY_DN56614_c3_g1~~TRINITY_DN56614_c3_g1_i1.p1  ORF type:complete len:473 (+),score=51.95 TRINITY_DN56614_c3_g1_i1:79-1419(+)